jgi:DMSO/TMAO reductase YedYZ molybdopterin-dependent catalytic subunit
MRNNSDERSGAERQMDDAGRLPPGQTLTHRFPVMHYGPVPAVDAQTWDFGVFGEVEKDARWSWEEFCRLPRARLKMDIHCVTTWSKLDTEWEGVSLRALVEGGLVRPKPGATVVLQHCELGYTTNVPLETALGENFLLATHFDGEPLTPEHGHPLRAVCGAIPGRDELEDIYFWKGGKWLRGLEFLEEDRLGFWELAGYHNRGGVWDEERFSER